MLSHSTLVLLRLLLAKIFDQDSVGLKRKENCKLASSPAYLGDSFQDYSWIQDF